MESLIFKNYLKAKSQLREIAQNSFRYFVIHYSCESFYNHNGQSPRIVVISIRSYTGGLTYSFSLDRTAEKLGFEKKQMLNEIDRIEYEMLSEFYSFLEKHKDKYWIHWNMSDENYGFQAIAHRYQCLEIKLYKRRSKKRQQVVVIDETRKVDLSRLLIFRYGSEYISHPRLISLIKENNFSTKDFLNGEEEAKYYECNNFDPILRSSLAKTSLFSKILDYTIDNKLKTNMKYEDVGDTWRQKYIYFVQNHEYGVLVNNIIWLLFTYFVTKGLDKYVCN